MPGYMETVINTIEETIKCGYCPMVVIEGGNWIQVESVALFREASATERKSLLDSILRLISEKYNVVDVSKEYGHIGLARVYHIYQK